MRLSFLVSILIHVLLLWVLLAWLDVVPEMRLPQRIYNVKILAPLVAARQEPAPAQVKEEVAPAKPKETAVVPKPKEKKQEKKTESPKPEPKETARSEQPLDVSVQQGSGGTSISTDGPTFPFSYYLSAIERKVSENWLTSEAGRGEGISCVVYFQLGRGGQVSALRIETSSGNPHFDRSALRAIQSAQPFPPLPRAFGDAWLGIHFTFLQKK